MGVWGMKITESDEFMNVYDEFMKKYDAGEEPADIERDILNRYADQFDDSDPVLHDVWFAIAKAEWMCCAQSETVLERVRSIIESGDNLRFYQELGADSKDLSLRRKSLRSFLDMLGTAREKARKRRPPAKEKVLPPLHIGDVISYPVEGGRRIAVILDVLDAEKLECRYFSPHYFCGILKRTYSKDSLKEIDPQREELGWIGLYDAVQFLPKSHIRNIGHIPILEDLYIKLFQRYHRIILIDGKRKDFTATFDTDGFMMGDLLNVQYNLPEGIKNENGWLV